MGNVLYILLGVTLAACSQPDAKPYPQWSSERVMVLDPVIGEIPVADPRGVGLAGICASLVDEHFEPEYENGHRVTLDVTGNGPLALLYENAEAPSACRIERNPDFPIVGIPAFTRGQLAYRALDARWMLIGIDLTKGNAQ